MLKKVTILTVLILILFSSFSFFAYSLESTYTEDNVESYYLYDLTHDFLMESKNTNLRISPSSTVKIMSACVVLESGIDLNQEIQITSEMIKNVSGRSMFLKTGDLLTVNDLLYAMLIGGYNDATNILALAVSPSLYQFTDKMNRKAKELGMDNTNYVNPTGIDSDGVYSTTEDIAKLTKYMIQNQVFVNICSTESYKLSDKAICDYKTITNRSSLLTEYRGLASLNIGSNDSGDCAVLYYNTTDISLISIVINAKDSEVAGKGNNAEAYSKSLLSRALNDYSEKLLKTQKSIIASLTVKYSIFSKEINVYLKEDLAVFLSSKVNPESDLTYSININNNELIAPLKSGDIVGTLTVFHDGVLLINVPLIVKENVDRNMFLYSMDVIKQFILSKLFLLCIMFFLIFLLCYSKSKKRKRKFKRKKKNKPINKTRKKPT